MSKFRDSRLYEALDYLDEAYVAEVVENLKVPPAPGVPTRKRGQLRYMVAFAACLLVLSAAIPVITYVMRNFGDFAGWFTDETTADTLQNLTEPETPPSETTAPPAPETSEDTAPETTETVYHETTEEPWPSTTAEPEPEYDGSRGLLYKMWEDGKSYYLAGMGICTDENILVASTYDGYPVTMIGEDALAGYDRVKSITIPDSVTAIDSRAFKNCTKLESITIPDGVYFIGPEVFSNCSSLKSIKLPQALELIQGSAFYGCTSLEKIIIPDFVTEIMPGAFSGCTNLSSFTLGRRVEKIWSASFDGCPNLTSLTFNGTVARWNVIEKEDGWNYESVISVVHCSNGDVEVNEYDGSRGLEYKISDDGKSASLVGIGTCTDKDIVVATKYNGSQVIAIGSYALYDCQFIESITIPEGVTVIGNEAFYMCKNLKKVTLPGTLEYIHDWAFANCESLESIVIPDRVKWICQNSFRDCKRLSSLTLGKGLEQIQESAFWNCSSIKSVRIPGSVSFFGNSAFTNCTALESVTVEKGIEYIPSVAFSGCRSLTEFIFTGSVAEWNALSKGVEWSQNCPLTEIVCSDGKATVSLLGDLGAIEAARKYWELDANAVIIVMDDPSTDLPLYKIAHCEYAQSVGEFEIKREVYVDPATSECSEVVYDYTDIPEMFLDIILNKEKFIYVDQHINANGEYQYMTEEVLFKDFSFTGILYDIFGKQSLSYTLLDIDGDSVSEFIIPGEARLGYGIMLRMYEGKIYGYRCMLDDLYTDATYRWHEQAGCFRGRSQVYFDGIIYKSRTLLEYDMNDPDNVKYYVEGKETTKEEYEKYESTLVGEPVKFTNLDSYPIYVNPYPGG